MCRLINETVNLIIKNVMFSISILQALSGNQSLPMAHTEVPHQRSNYGAPNLMAEG